MHRFHLSAVALVAMVFGVFSFVPLSQGQDVVLTETWKNAGGSEVRVVRVFNGSVARGFEPYQITIRNRTGKALNLTVGFSFGDNYRGDSVMRSEFRISADANGESVHQLLAPVPPVGNRGGYYYSNGTVTVSGAGLSRKAGNIEFTRNRDWPAIGISERLAKRSLSDLNDTYENSGVGGSGYGNTEFAMRFDAEQLPGDWRGFSGLDALMITFDEWRDTAAAAQQGILEWVRLGGRLLLYTDSGEDLKALGLAVGSRSTGSIERFTWGEETLATAATFSVLSKTEARGIRIATDYVSDWGVQEKFPLKDFNTALIVFLLIAFGVTVGPINLFVFAKAGKRHRLFITTPLISIIASLVIAVLILISDGIGGSGTRLLFVDLQPDPTEKKAYLVQEQFSRSGVLLSSSFEVDDAASFSPVRLKASRWYKDKGGQFRLSGTSFSGDWFLSRSEQAQLIEAVRPSRSRVELRRAAAKGEAPQLFSSVDFSLDSLHYIDGSGKVWKARTKSIGAGAAIELTEIKRNEFINWWKSQTLSFSNSNRDQLRALPKQRNVFFATSEDPKVGFVETLDGIRWKKDRAVIFGAVLATAGVQPSPAAQGPAAADTKPEPKPKSKDSLKAKPDHDQAENDAAAADSDN